MSSKKWKERLQKLDGAVTGDYNPFAHVIRTPSPSTNFVFGNTWGLPLGYSMALYGPPKAGKSVLCNAMVGQLHRDDPEAFAIKYNTEMREGGQLTPEQALNWGIDMDRYQAYDTNIPEEIFDKIENDIAEAIEDGLPLKLIIIDSINGIRGRRDLNSTSISQMQIGDHALTIQEGLKRILATVRRNRIALILTTHVRAEMDQWEIRRGNDKKMAGAWALKHFAEYFVYIEQNQTKAGRVDLEGKEFVNKELVDLGNKGEQLAHKIRVVMKDSSVGPKGRMGEFTLDYDRGIINTHEEVFLLGVNRGIIERPNNVTYKYGDQSWRGKMAMANAIRDNDELYQMILSEVMKQDMEKKPPPVHTELTMDQLT